MLQALLAADITPDLVVGTSIGAMNGAFVAQEPEPSVVERLLSLWQGAASSGRRDLLGAKPLRTVGRAVASRGASASTFVVALTPEPQYAATSTPSAPACSPASTRATPCSAP